MCGLRCYSLLENTFLFGNFVEVKTFQTLDSNSIILLIILKRNLSHILKKYMFMSIKCLIVTMLRVSACLSVIFILRQHNRLRPITLIGIVLSGRCPGVIYPGGQLSQEEIVHVQLSVDSFPRQELSGGNCPGAIVWEAIILGGDCVGAMNLGGNCPGGIILFPFETPILTQTGFFFE